MDNESDDIKDELRWVEWGEWEGLAYEKNQEVDCRDKVLHTEERFVILREKATHVGGREIVFSN